MTINKSIRALPILIAVQILLFGGCSARPEKAIELESLTLLSDELVNGYQLTVNHQAIDSPLLVTAQQQGVNIKLIAENSNGELIAGSDIVYQVRSQESLLLAPGVADSVRIRIVPVMLTQDGAVLLRIQRLGNAKANLKWAKAEALLAQAKTPTSSWDPQYWRQHSENVKQAQQIFSHLGLFERLAHALFTGALIDYTYLSEWHGAERQAYRSESLFQSIDKPMMAANARVMRAMALIEKPEGASERSVRQRREKANRLFEHSAGTQFTRQAQADLSWTRNNQAIGQYYNGGQDDAETGFKKARDIALEVGALSYYRIASKNLIAIRGAEDEAASIQQLRFILEGTSPKDDPVSYGLTALQLGERYLEYSYWTQAVQTLATAKEYLEFPADQLHVRIGLSRAYLQAGNLHRAKHNAREASLLASQNREHTADLRLSLLRAELARAEGGADEALRILRAAQASHTNSREEAEILTEIGQVHLLNKNFHHANLAAQTAMSLLRDRGRPLDLARALLLNIEIELNGKQNQAVLTKLLSQADEIVKTLQQPLLLAKLHSLEAQYMHQNGELERALAASTAAVDITLSQRRLMGSSDYKSGLVEAQKNVLEQHADFMSLRSPKRLFEFVDELRTESLNLHALHQAANARQENSLSYLRDEISYLTHLLHYDVDLTKRDRTSLQDRLEQAFLQYDTNTRDFRLSTPLKQETGDLARLQSTLGAKSLILAFWLRGDKPAMWAITRKQFKMISLTAWETTASAAEQLRSSIINARKDYKARAKSVFSAIFSDKELFDGIEQVYLIPDSVLSYVPLLGLEKPKLSVQYASSVAALKVRHKRLTQQSKVIVFGEPQYNDEALRPLPASNTEVDAISAVFRDSTPAILTDSSASRRNFIARAGKHDIVHVALHASFDAERPLLSGINFSDETDSRNGSMLTLNDIRSMNLQESPLVVLSACSTAFGRHPTIEGYSGFPNAFLASGANEVLVSLWDVPDRSTAYLMAAFYDSLINDQNSTAKALRIAQEKVRQIPEWEHPLYWAGWILISNALNEDT